MAGGPGHAGPDSQQRFERAQFKWLQDLKTTGAKVVQVTYPRTANNDKELTVIRGEYLEVSITVYHSILCLYTKNCTTLLIFLYFSYRF